MITHLPKLLKIYTTPTRRKISNLYLFLISFNIMIWVIALTIFKGFPLLIGTSVIAYSFGLRHAVDADHIAAIDNVTRKLMHEKKKPVAAGFYFSLGHSTVVVLASVVIAFTAASLQKNFPQLQNMGRMTGTIISAGFLFLIALLNMFILRDVFRKFRKVKMGGSYDEQTFDDLLGRRGLISRIFHPFYKLINQSWHMYPLGFLFGLGFDTATEIGLLGITAIEATKGLPVWSILIFPALFAAGMSLIDTTDGVLMLAAYGWAYLIPLRKLYYNVTITFVSVLVALLVGGIEVFNIIGGKLKLNGWFWNKVAQLSSDFTVIGYFIIGIFVISWLGSTIIYKLKKYDEIEAEQRKAVEF
jgi:high-affinity nickel-transport protein